MTDHQPELYPLLLEPALHTKVWGGRRLGDMMGKSLPTDDPYGESWEVHDSCTVANGPLAGQTLADLLPVYGEALIGKGNDPAAGMPLLAKLLDATEWLSIQVHPNDKQAAKLEGEPRGKTEAWVILHAEEGAQLVIGVEPGTSREAMAEAIREGKLEEMVVYKQVSTGDVLLLEANTVHAVGPGLVIYEIQQSSDTTYRLYDWNRIGLDGNLRELHIDKGVQVANVDFLPEITHPWAAHGPVITLVESSYFKSNWHRIGSGEGVQTLHTHGRFHALTCVSGSVTITTNGNTLVLELGQSALIPANTGRYTLSGAGDLIRSWQIGPVGSETS